MKYRRISSEVEAFQYFGGDPVPAWASERGTKLPKEERVLHFWNRPYDMEMEAKHGDYVIDQGNGDRYPCKSEIFKKTYREVFPVDPEYFESRLREKVGPSPSEQIAAAVAAEEEEE